MIFNIKTSKDKFTEEVYERSMKELGEFFGIQWKYNRPYILLVPDRKTINKLFGEKTEKWVVGWRGGDGVYILDRKNYEKESSHK